AGLQAEASAPVGHEGELHVASAAEELEGSLALAVRMIFPSREEGLVGEQIMLGQAAYEREAVLEALLGEIVEEDAADAPRLLAMLKIEVLVAGFLVSRVEVLSEGIAGRLGG